MRILFRIAILIKGIIFLILWCIAFVAAVLLSVPVAVITYIFTGEAYPIFTKTFDALEKLLRWSGDKENAAWDRIDKFCESSFFSRCWKHLRRICRHKSLVFKYSRMFGIPLRGLFHDLSKFHPVEFFESVKYWYETGSPINEAKKQKGYSNAWYHHRSRNRHHWEYWADNFESGTNCPIMPYKYTVEMLCDFLAAGKTYQGDKFTFSDELSWWRKKREVVKMHKVNRAYLDEVLTGLANAEQSGTVIADPKEYSKACYRRAYDTYKDEPRTINS